MKSVFKWIQIVFLVTLAVFALQYFLLGILGAAWSLDMILKVFVFLGASSSGMSFHSIAYKELMILLFPIRVVLQTDSIGSGTLINSILLFTANSAIWGVGFGSVVYAFWKKCKRPAKEGIIPEL